MASEVRRRLDTKYEGTIDNSFARGKGRMFGRWIDYLDKDGTARTTGVFDSGDLIESPVSCIESLFRDELHTERVLTVDSTSADNKITCLNLKGFSSDYYDNSIIHNIDTDFVGYITSFSVANKELTLNANDTSLSAGDKFILSNINSDNKIHTASFDALNHATTGARKDWKFAFSINYKVDVRNILESMLYECNCNIFESQGKYKIKAIEIEDTGVDTWTKPMISKDTKEEMFDISFTSPIYNNFKFYYNNDRKEISVNKDSVTPNLTYIGNAEKELCKYNYYNSYNNNVFTYSMKYINDDTTAELLARALIYKLGTEKSIITWGGDFYNHCKYEIHDQVKLNNTKLIPYGLNNSNFSISRIHRISNVGSPYILFKLIEV